MIYIINERTADIGNFQVGRLLPVREKRSVGPFVFVDHMGPAEIAPGRYLDVDQHPHIGLSTLTYLFKGIIEHRDSCGSIQLINPGDAGFMTAGKAVTHTERTPKNLRDGSRHGIHGYQIWIGLPADKEEMDASFQHYPAESLPKWDENSMSIRLIAGSAFGKKSPLMGHSPLFLADIIVYENTTLNLEGQYQGEIAIAIAEGQIDTPEGILTERQMLICDDESLQNIEVFPKTRLVFFGGIPFPEKRQLLWNFVSSRRERLIQAKEDWKKRRFPKVPGDNTYVPIPD